MKWMKLDRYFLMASRVNDDWMSLYRFNLTPINIHRVFFESYVHHFPTPFELVGSIVGVCIWLVGSGVVCVGRMTCGKRSWCVCGKNKNGNESNVLDQYERYNHSNFISNYLLLSINKILSKSWVGYIRNSSKGIFPDFVSIRRAGFQWIFLVI